MPSQEFLHDGGPDRDCVWVMNEEMPVLPERREQVIFSRPPGGSPGSYHSFRQGGTKKGIVFKINPESRDSCSTPELPRGFDQVIRLAIVIRFAFEMTATTAHKIDHSANHRWVQAGESKGRPTARRLTEYDCFAVFNKKVG